MRIHITGNAGSGKSTLAKEVGLALDLDVYGMDRVVWQEGWNERSPSERLRLEKEICQKDSWVIDGVSSLARETADLVVFIDFTRAHCYWRCAKRNWRYLFRSRPDLPENCPEIMVIPKLTKIIWQFPIIMRPKILLEAAGSNQAFIKLNSNIEIEDFCVHLRHNKSKHSDLAKLSPFLFQKSRQLNQSGV